MALGYASDSKKKLSVLGTGMGGFAALRAHLTDDALVYSAFKASVGGSSRWLFLCSVGASCGNPIQSHPVLSHPTPSHPIPCQIPSYPIPPYPISSHLSHPTLILSTPRHPP